jgi:hypothetical protein
MNHTENTVHLFLHSYMLRALPSNCRHKWFDNKVRELVTVYLTQQQWAETSVWIDDVATSSFHSCVVIYGSLFLSGVNYCLSVFWCVVMRMSERTLTFMLNLARVETEWERS